MTEEQELHYKNKLLRILMIINLEPCNRFDKKQRDMLVKEIWFVNI